MGLVEGECPLTWFLTTALLSKPEMKVSSVYTWRGDTAEGVWIFPGQYMTTQVLFLKGPSQKLIRSSRIPREQL